MGLDESLRNPMLKQEETWLTASVSSVSMSDSEKLNNKQQNQDMIEGQFT